VAQGGRKEQAVGFHTETPDIFVSYASQDVSFANAVVAVLESQGFKCWIAPRDITPGLFYADAIVQALNAAQLLIVVLSAHSVASQHVLREVERASSKKRPLLAFRLDATPLPPGLEYFLSASHWLDASGGAIAGTLPQLVEAVRTILTVPASSAQSPAREAAPLPSIWRRLLIITALLLLTGGSLFWLYLRPTVERAESSAAKQRSATPSKLSTVVADAFAPPAHSIAVLPFVNMSGDPKQEYFSDGISEELLDSLSRLSELQVAARTSSFSFKGQNADISTIARKLNVGNILEGSVRRFGNTLRITVQLINAVNGFHLWSKTYDRKSTDVLHVQSEVANAVALKLEGTLAGGTSIFDRGGTGNPQAYDAFLRGIHLESNNPVDDESKYRASLAMYDQAIALDPQYADAYAKRAGAITGLLNHDRNVGERMSLVHQAIASAEKAVSIAPERGELHMRLAQTRMATRLDFAAAAPEFERALALAPGNSPVLSAYSEFAVNIGHVDSAVMYARRAVDLDRQNSTAYSWLSWVLFAAHRYAEALATLQDAKRLAPEDASLDVQEIKIDLGAGPTNQTVARCESPSVPLSSDFRPYCLAVAYHAVGRQGDAETQLEQMKQSLGDAGALSYAELYALWGDKPRALQWLVKGEALHDPALLTIRWAWPYESIRDDPVFKAVERRMNFPP
jgi:TolB-like protein